MDKGTVCSPSSPLATAALKSKENKQDFPSLCLRLRRSMATFTKPFYALLFLARLTSVIVAVLVLIWAFRFRTSFLLPSSSKTDTVFSVLHPLVMVIGFILVSGEAILIHKALPSWSRNFKKSLHLFLQAVALGLGFFGIWIKFYKYKGFANFYSLHSWMGLICMCLFVSQWIVGFMSFWHRGEVRGVRVYVLPWHVFVGLYTYALSVATAETGLLEKLTFLQAKGLVLRNSPESMVANFLGLGLSLLGALVILAAAKELAEEIFREKEKEFMLASFLFLSIIFFFLL